MGAGGRPDEGIAKGDLKFVLHGERLQGKWVLVRMRPRRASARKHENWLLIKERDEYAGEEKKPIIERALTSVRTGRTMEEIAAGNVEWTEGTARKKSAGEATPAAATSEARRGPSDGRSRRAAAEVRGAGACDADGSAACRRRTGCTRSSLTATA